MGKPMLVGAVVATGMFAFASAAGAASIKASNWPNSPALHRSGQVVRSTPSFTANLRGGVAVAGNTLETCPANLPFVNNEPSGSPASEPCIGTYNNGLDMQYVNVDPGNGRFNSSTATLTIPAGATVVRAFLYWAADLTGGVGSPRTGHDAFGGNTPEGQSPLQTGSTPTINSTYGTIDFRAGASGAYSAINAFDQAPDQARWDSINSWYTNAPGTQLGGPEGSYPGWAYQVRADVTSQLENAIAGGASAIARRARPRAGDQSIPITVANVQAGTGNNRYAGWNLIVVWQSPTAQFRNITLFDGFDFVQVQWGESLVVGPLDFTGFRTPHSENLDSHVTVWATEGDRTLTGDYMSLGDLTGNCDTLTKQSNAAHPINDFFNSSISNGAVNVGGRAPGFNNQLGFDLITLDVPEGTIARDATGASVCLGTVGDTYFFGGLIFDTLIRAPNLHIAKSADKSTAHTGDTVTYTTTVSNPQRAADDPLGPTDAATGLVVADPIPSGLEFVRFTDNPGDVCSYFPASREIECEVGDLAPDASFSFSFEARVSAVTAGDNPEPLINAACYAAASVDQPDASFTGCDQAPVTVSPGGPPPADLGVVKTVSHEIVKPGDTITWHVVGTNHGPATSTGFTLSDELPAGVEFVRATHSGALTCTTPAVGSSGAITCTAPNPVPVKPAAGSSLTLTITANVPSTIANGTLLLNVATVSGDQPEPLPDPHPNRDETLTRVLVPGEPIPPGPPLPPDPNGPPELPGFPELAPNVPTGNAGTLLALRKIAAPASVPPGGTIVYTLRLRNNGDASALHVRLCDRLPSGVTITSAAHFVRSGSSVCTTISPLVGGTRRTFHLIAQAGPGTQGRVVNHATATASNASTVRSTASTLVVGPPLVTG
jgi:uncharacterized repeat protein (TIGR01451 family)